MRNAETMQLIFLLIIHVAMGEVAPTRLAATAGRSRASRADAALDRLREVEGDTDNSDDGNEALDALCDDARMRMRNRLAENAKSARAGKKRIRENVTIPRPEMRPADVIVTYGWRTTVGSQSEKHVRSPSTERYFDPGAMRQRGAVWQDSSVNGCAVRPYTAIACT